MKNAFLKSYLFLMCALFFPTFISARENYAEMDSYFNHLAEINKEWNKHESALPEGLICFASDADRIQLHLKLVCNSLLHNVPFGLTQEQLKNRLQLIDELSAYADTK